MVEFLVAAGSELHAEDASGSSALSIACDTNQFNLLEFLIEKGVDSSRKNMNGITVLWKALINGNFDVTKELLRCGADVNDVNSQELSPLHMACSSRNVTLVKLLVDHGANTVLKDSKGQSALHCASSLGFVDIIEILLAAGASLESRTEPEGYTPLHVSCCSNEVDAAMYLIEKGADINMESSTGLSAVHLAFAASLSLQFIWSLHNAGADFFKKTQRSQNSVFHIICENLDLSKELVKDETMRALMLPLIHVKNADMQTGLHVACNCGNQHILTLFSRGVIVIH